MKKPRIDIFDSVGVGIILAYPSGVEISNQTGGTNCLRPTIEGVYLPLRNDYEAESKTYLSPEFDLGQCFMDEKYAGTGACQGIDNDDVLRLEEILKKHQLDFIKINEAKLKDSHEAWIHIMIVEPEMSLFTGFEPYPRQGILTWANSD